MRVMQDVQVRSGIFFLKGNRVKKAREELAQSSDFAGLDVSVLGDDEVASANQSSKQVARYHRSCDLLPAGLMALAEFAGCFKGVEDAGQNISQLQQTIHDRVHRKDRSS